MIYHVGKRQMPVPKPIAELIARYNAASGAILADAEAAGIASGDVLSIVEKLNKRVHENHLLRRAAAENSQRDYVTKYRQVLEDEVDDSIQEADGEARKVLEFVGKQPLSTFDALATDSYTTHREEDAA